MIDGGTVGLIFSKDRAMQLDAVLQSLYMHCPDIDDIDLKVIYTVSNEFHENQYAQLISHYRQVEFIREIAFKPQVIASVAAYDYVLFLVDDNIVVRDFSMQEIIGTLKTTADAIGFSLRLGVNITFCYPHQKSQDCPFFIPIGNAFIKFAWPLGKYDFGYPLEISSSLYRVADILEILKQANYFNPNTLEVCLSSHSVLFLNRKNMLICNQHTLSFCNPVNMVQSTCNNLAGITIHYDVEALAQRFEVGERIDVGKYSGFTPHSCHQEVELLFTKSWNEPKEVHR